MPTRRIAIGAVIALIAMTRAAFGDPTPLQPPVNLHLKSPSTVHTDGGSDLRLPPGYFLDEGTHSELDTEMRRLQNQETRLSAENRSLRGYMASWQPGWVLLATTLAGGVALGWYVKSQL